MVCMVVEDGVNGGEEMVQMVVQEGVTGGEDDKRWCTWWWRMVWMGWKMTTHGVDDGKRCKPRIKW